MKTKASEIAPSVAAIMFALRHMLLR